MSRYDEVNRQIHRIEPEDEPTTNEILERLKKERLKLKDQIPICSVGSSTECRVTQAAVIPPSRKLGFVKPFCKMVMQVRIVDDRRGDRALAERLGLS